MFYVFGMTQTPEELYIQGANAYNNGDYKTAVNYLSKASEQNHAGAQRVLGSCYLNGYGVEKNISKAVEWFKKAKDNGDVYAAEKYSNIIEDAEEVLLYKKICDPSEQDLRYQYGYIKNGIAFLVYDIPFLKNCKTYIEKYANSGYNIDEPIINGLQKMNILDQFRTSIALLELTSYLADKPALEEKIKNILFSSLNQHPEEKRLELSLNALQSKISDKNKNLLKTQLKIMEAGYTTIKTKSSADRYWVSIIDQYLTCFPTSTHKTELNTLKSKYVAECNRREAEERRRQEEERRSQGQQKNVNAENYKGKYVTVVVRDSETSCNFPHSSHYYNITIYGRCALYNDETGLYLYNYDTKIISIKEARGESTDNCVYNKLYDEWKEKDHIYKHEIISISVQ